VANLVYAGVVAAVAVAFGAAVLDLRDARVHRFASAEAHAAYRTAADACVGAALGLAALAAFALVGAVA
jgi:hypothetical protein